MFIAFTESPEEAGPAPQPGQQMAFEMQDEAGKVLHREIYDIAETDPPEGMLGRALSTTLAEVEWPDPDFRAAQIMDTVPQGAEEVVPQGAEEVVPQGAEEAVDPKLLAEAGKIGVEAAKLGWDIIKSNRAVTDLKGASTSLLNPGNMNPFDYTGAREGSSPHYYWSGYNWPIKTWKAFEVWLKVSGAYGAQAPAGVASGLYIPSLYVEFPRTPWAGFGLRMDASVSVMPPWNAGRGQVVAQCDLVATVTVSSIVDPSRPRPFKFGANAQRGFWRR